MSSKYDSVSASEAVRKNTNEATRRVGAGDLNAQHSAPKGAKSLPGGPSAFANSEWLQQSGESAFAQRVSSSDGTGRVRTQFWHSRGKGAKAMEADR